MSEYCENCKFLMDERDRWRGEAEARTRHNERLHHKIDRLRASNAELLAALEGVANNRFSIDVPEDERADHNYAQGWDALISHARAAIANARKES